MLNIVENVEIRSMVQTPTHDERIASIAQVCEQMNMTNYFFTNDET